MYNILIIFNLFESKEWEIYQEILQRDKKLKPEKN